MAYGKSKLVSPEIVQLEIEPPGCVRDGQQQRWTWRAPGSVATATLLTHTARQLQRVANQCVVSWLLHHERHSTLLKLECGAKVHPCPPELCARWLREGQALVPDVSSATVLAVTNWLAQTFTSQKSPRSNLKRWIRVLRREESHWAYDSPLPVRLWNGNAKIVRDAAGLAVVVRIDRRLVPGKSRAESTPLTLRLMRPGGGNRSAGHRKAWLAAAEIADGKRHFSQSQIVERHGRWCMMLTVEGPEPAESSQRDATKTLFVRPGRRDALRLRASALGSGGVGESELDRVAKIRRSLDERRESCRKSHGRAPKNVSVHLSALWRQHAAAISHRLADAVAKAVAGSPTYGRVIWLDGNNRTSALALAGKNGDRDNRELFPFEALRGKAASKLKRLGVELLGRANFRSVKRRASEAKKRPRNAAKNKGRSQNGSGDLAAQGLRKAF